MGLLRRGGGLRGLPALFPGDGFDWYVDSVNGDDANTGKSSGAAFATISALESEGISEGDSIGLARGSHWREQLDITVSNVSVEAYGSGDDPLLDASEVALNESFEKTDGQTNVYEISVSLVALFSEQFVNVYEDDVNLSRVADIATCDSTAGSYYPSAENGDIVLYIHTTNSDNPASNDNVYEYTARNFGIDTYWASGCSLIGLHARRNLCASGSIRAGRSNAITNCTAQDGNSHNILVRDGCVLTDVTLTDSYNGTSGATMFFYNEANPMGLGITVTDCTAVCTVPIAVLVTGYHGHMNDSGSFGEVVYNNCIASELSVGFINNHADNVRFNGCITSTCNIGYQFSDSSVEYHLTDCEHAINSDSDSAIATVGADVTINIDECNFTSDMPSNYGIVRINNAGIALNITDSVFEITATSGAYRQVIYCTAAITVTANGNTYTIADAFTDGVCYYLTGAVTLSSDYNHFSHGEIRNLIGGDIYNTITEYQAATGQDTNSTVGS